MWPVLVSAIIAAAPTESVRLASVGFSGAGVPAELLAFYAEHFAVKLAQQGFRVVTEKDMATVLGVERQKALLGCTDQQPSCMAELAGALGVDGLVTGQLAQLGSTYQVNIKVLSGVDASSLFIHSQRVQSETELADELEKAAAAAAVALGVRAARPTAPPEASARAAASPESGRTRIAPWVTLAAGVAATATGLGFAVRAALSHRTLTGPGAENVAYADAVAAREAGRSSQLVGAIALALGAAAVGAGVLWLLLGDSAPPVAALLGWSTRGWAGVFR